MGRIREHLVVRGSVKGIGAQASDAELWALGPHVTVETISGVGQLPHDEEADRVLELMAVWSAANK